MLDLHLELGVIPLLPDIGRKRGTFPDIGKGLFMVPPRDRNVVIIPVTILNNQLLRNIVIISLIDV